MNRTIALVALALTLTSFAETDPKTWYVDDDWYGRGGAGTIVAPFGTIQDAVDAASAGDTIRVAEGVYDQGGKAYYDDDKGETYGLNRVLIDKSLTIIGAGREKSIIVGAYDNSVSTKCGMDAVRCVMCDPSVSDVRVEGFMLTGGATHGDTSAPNSKAAAGGFYAGGTSKCCYLVDSTVKDCKGNRGGGVYGSILIRCYVSGNQCFNMGAAAHSSALWCCIVSGNTSASVTLEGCQAMLCTVACNAGVSYALYDGGYYYNVLNVANATRNQSGNIDSAKNCVIGYQAEAYAREKFESCVHDADNYEQVMSPATGDFRLVKGSDAETAGDAEWIAQWARCEIPAADKYLDFNKNPIPQTGTICVGAIQETVVPMSGRYTIATSGFAAPFGAATRSEDLWVRTADYPAQVRFAKDGQDRTIYAYSVNDNGASNYRAPEMDESIVLTMPPQGLNVKAYIQFAAAEFYVDPVNGKDDEDGHDGSDWSKAFKSVNYAGAKVTQDKTIIRCAAGDYTEANSGSVVSGGHNTRVGRTGTAATKSVYYKGPGAAQATIWGASDPAHLDDGERGCGDDACRCVSFAASGDILQGFTLKNGYSKKFTADVTGNGQDGGAVYSPSRNSVVSDCVILDSVALRGGAAYGSVLIQRTRVRNCRGYNGVFRACRAFVASDFRNCFTSVGTVLYNEAKYAYNMNYVYGTGSGNSNFMSHPGLVNSIYVGAEGSSATLHYDGCVAWKGQTVRSGLSVVDPQIVSDDDLRLRVTSQAIDCGAAPTTDNFGTNWWMFATTDIDGNLLKFTADGKVCPGCCHTLASVAIAPLPKYGTSSAAATNDLPRGGSVTISYQNGSPARPFSGIVVDGVTNKASSVTISDVPAGDPAKVVSVEFLANGTNWYVNASAVDDRGDGFSPETAKKTLAGVFTGCGVLAGDCVHAAAGVYGEGAMCVAPFTSGSVSNRVQIAAGVALVGEGPDVCSIVGAGSPETGSNTDSYKRGPGAIKCVYMAADSTLKGFTVCGGRSGSAEMSGTTYPSTSDYVGGGIQCADNTTCKIYDCIISNNAAIRSGGVHKGLLVNCRIEQNIGSGGNLGSGGEANAFVGCYLGKQVNDGSTFREPLQIENCTLNGIAISYGVPKKTIKNSLLINMTTTSGTMATGAATLEGCILDEESWANLHDSKYATGTWTDCTHYSTAELNLDELGRPLAGSKAIDAAKSSLVPGYVTALTDRDAGGSQRVYNGRVDVGAYEYDYRGDFAAALGGQVEVVAADPMVVLEDGLVAISNGTLIAEWTNPDAPQAQRVAFAATCREAGSLEIAQDGEAFATQVATAGRKAYQVKNGAAATQFAFTYLPEVGTLGSALLDSFGAKTVGLLLLLR